MLPRLAALGLLAALAAGCTRSDVPAGETPDPFENVNRSVHAFNKGLDRNVLRPSSDVYVTAVPQPARKGISNGVNTLSQPVYFANHLLQGDIEDAGGALTRFLLNGFFGLGGMLDVASEAGVFDNPTDFGETMAVWGVPSGPYVELPVFGPSTVRDSFGRVVDRVGDPVPGALPDGSTGYLVAAEVADVLQIRSDLGRVIDALLYESADSYAAARIAYLQNRSRAANDGVSAEELENPYDF
ncbi:VacJ family lipoprotein [Halovulum dunhuangense]|uniref:VacJ family lipoprotein n=1 Tax=Halovulum dunhuangense TaxID=1505036 RepID=A0A849L6B2_9RHOB|nr:VacJ family lipoprotein [Halovulum dunhuangense]